MADLIELSDHRPVCAAFDVAVDKRIRHFKRLYQHADAEDDNDDEEDNLAVFSFSIRHPHYHQAHVGQAEGLKEESEDAENHEELDKSTTTTAAAEKQTAGVQPRQLQLVFPLVSEDPVYEERIASALSEVRQALYTAYDDDDDHDDINRPHSLSDPCHHHFPPQAFPGVTPGAHNENATLTSGSIRQIAWSDFPCKFEIVASKRFSQHAMFKVRGKGQEKHSKCV